MIKNNNNYIIMLLFLPIVVFGQSEKCLPPVIDEEVKKSSREITYLVEHVNDNPYSVYDFTKKFYSLDWEEEVIVNQGYWRFYIIQVDTITVVNIPFQDIDAFFDEYSYMISDNIPPPDWHQIVPVARVSYVNGLSTNSDGEFLLSSTSKINLNYFYLNNENTVLPPSFGDFLHQYSLINNTDKPMRVMDLFPGDEFEFFYTLP